MPVMINVLLKKSGLIGRGWAMLFAGAGYSVSLYDVNRELVVSAIKDIEEQLKVLEETGMLRGALSAAQQLQLINCTRLHDKTRRS